MLVHCANVKCKANVGNDVMPNANKTKIQTNTLQQMQISSISDILCFYTNI